MRIINPTKPHNYEPHVPIRVRPASVEPGCRHCGASKRNLRLHPNEDDYR